MDDEFCAPFDALKVYIYTVTTLVDDMYHELYIIILYRKLILNWIQSQKLVCKLNF